MSSDLVNMNTLVLYVILNSENQATCDPDKVLA